MNIIMPPILQKILIFAVILFGSIIILKLLDKLIFNKYLLKKVNIHIPALYRDMLIFIILAIIILVTIRIEFGIKLTGILTSSAIISAIIGLALQDTLANIIAGIVLHIEKPFKIGDWIKVGECEGEIVEINWRATRLKTIDGNYIIIPNTNISKETILNFYEPTKAHAITLKIGLEYKMNPSKAKETIFRAIRDCDNILREPNPAINITNFGDYAIEYEIKFWISNHSIYKEIKDDLLTKIWYGFKRDNIHVPFPIRTIYMQKETEPVLLDNEEIIQKIELFRDMTENDIKELARRSKIKHFTNGERIITQDEEGDSLYAIINGQVNIISNAVPIRELKKGKYFGEMSLLTGEKRSATAVAQNEVTVLEIDKNSIMPIIKKNPNLLEILSKILAERKLLTKDILDKAQMDKKLLEKDALSKSIFNKIKTFLLG